MDWEFALATDVTMPAHHAVNSSSRYHMCSRVTASCFASRAGAENACAWGHVRCFFLHLNEFACDCMIGSMGNMSARQSILLAPFAKAVATALVLPEFASPKTCKTIKSHVNEGSNDMLVPMSISAAMCKHKARAGKASNSTVVRSDYTIIYTSFHV